MLEDYFPADDKGGPRLPNGFLAVTFAFALGGLWEIFEFFLDLATGLNTQIDLCNTMCDTIINLLGATAFVAANHLYRYSRNYYTAETVILLGKGE